MTKYASKLTWVLDEWFKTHNEVSKVEYKLFKELCKEVLK